MVATKRVSFIQNVYFSLFLQFLIIIQMSQVFEWEYSMKEKYHLLDAIMVLVLS